MPVRASFSIALGVWHERRSTCVLDHVPLIFFVHGHDTPLCVKHLSSSLANAGACYKLSIYVIGLWAPVSNLSGCASSAFFTAVLLCMPFPMSLHDSAVFLDRSFVNYALAKQPGEDF